MKLFKKKVKYTHQDVRSHREFVIQYYGLDNLEEIRYKILKTLIGDNNLLVQLDTNLFAMSDRINEKEYIEHRAQLVENYGFPYRLKKIPKIVNRDNIFARLLSLGDKDQSAYLLAFIMPADKVTRETVDTFFPHHGVSLGVCKDGDDGEEILEWIYSGIIEDKAPWDVYKAEVFDNPFIGHTMIKTKVLTKDFIQQMVKDLNESFS
ncbi:MAG TPA: hypothetical protein GXZ32_04895 [Clostridiales bacterium]|nr:hypothetical protein [Clostridiales bacterium]